jgi:predicted transcriptional regulator
MISSAEDQIEMLQRHLELLQYIVTNEPIGIVKLSKESGHPKHKVRYSLRILEEADLIVPTQNGAVTTEQSSEFVDEINKKIDDLEQRFTAMKIDM